MNLAKTYVPDKNTFRELLMKREGRINRLRYFKRNLLVLLIVFVEFLLAAIAFSEENGGTARQMDIAYIIILIFGNYLMYCLDLRRMYDLGLARAKELALGLFVLSVIHVGINFSPLAENPLATALSVVSSAACLYLLFAKGETGANQYGPDPLETA
ncbi:MAG: DUF805 domain-containing protein [Selenomonadaceae bacterium]|nr:DUF805 domain-containing protein [Selenomonadaceae bacterium]